METRALDEMDHDYRRKWGREVIEDTTYDQIKTKEQEIRELREQIKRVEEDIRELREQIKRVREQIKRVREQIKRVEEEIAIASETEVRMSLEAKLQFLRQETSSLYQQISSRDQQISSRDQQISSRDQQISILRQEIISIRSVQEASASAVIASRTPLPAAYSKPPFTIGAMKKLLEDQMTELMRAMTPKSAILSLSMSSVNTKVADDVLKMAGLSMVDGSVVEPAGEVSVSKEWEFDMGQYAREEDCYEPFFKHMVEYLNTVHAVKIQKDPPFPRDPGYCRLLDVHNSKDRLELEIELGDRTLKITGNLDAAFVPPRRGILQYKNSLLGGVEVKHSTAHKEIFEHGAPTVGIGKSGRSAVPGQVLMEALSVYAYSDFPKGIFLLTSYDENAVMELKDGEIWYWAELNFAQAMDKIAAFLKGEDVQEFLKESAKPARSLERPVISESKRSVRKKLKVEGLGNEEFLEQVDVVRSAAGSKLEMMSDLFQLVESWRYSTTEACGSPGPLSYFS